MTADFKSIAERISGMMFFGDATMSPSMPDALMSAEWKTFVRDLASELRKEFGEKK